MHKRVKTGSIVFWNGAYHWEQRVTGPHSWAWFTMKLEMHRS